MSEASAPVNDLLIVGSGLEAYLALQKFSRLEFGGKLIHLPAPANDGSLFVGKADWNQGGPAPKQAWLVDVWGKKVLSLKLPKLSQFEPGPLPVESMPTGLSVNRTQRGEQGVTATLSDGSDVLCQGVLFCDGADSGCRKFWDKPMPAEADPNTVQRWAFITQNLLNLERWDFRWATAKSVELVPLTDNKLRVRLRFKSRHGGKLTRNELSDLFSEFGSDMTALFEGLSDDQVEQSFESSATRAVHRPAQGCLALGRAAWCGTPFLTFDWLAKYVDKQLNVLAEQLRTGPLQEESFEAQAKELLQDLNQSELFVRRQLHSDNTLLNPIRNLLLSILPNAFLAGQVRKRLY